MNSIATKITRNHPSPLPVSTDLLTQKRFEVELSSATTSTFTVSPAALIGTVPGGTALWDKVQFHKFDVWGGPPSYASTGSSMSPVTVTLHSPTTSGFGDTPTGYSDPVGTARRAHIGMLPNTLFRNTWYNSNDTNVLLTITSSNNSPGTPGACVLQFTAILRSTGTSVTESSEADVSFTPHHERKQVLDPHVVFTLYNNAVTQIGPVNTIPAVVDPSLTSNLCEQQVNHRSSDRQKS